MASGLRHGLLSLIVPPLCAVCREPELSGAALCPDCRLGLVVLREPRCRFCGAPAQSGSHGCRECRRRGLNFDRAWSPFAYEGVARKTAAALKTGGALAVCDLMAGEIANRAPGGLLAGTLVPVPAHSRRRRRHGFNQAAGIARALGRRTGLPTAGLLERRASTRPQVGLERRARLLNAAGSVRMRRGSTAPGRVVLVDDVYTTGATLDACARELEAAGAAEVVAVTFARAVRN
jgi:ComF family protein